MSPVPIGFHRRVFDYTCRCILRLVYPFATVIWRFSARDGVAAAVWVTDRLLVVRHSYKPGLSIPGGGSKSGEAHRLTIVRELREEVGIIVDADALRLVSSKPVARHHCHFYELHLPTEPPLVIDRQEIVHAAFVPRNQLRWTDCDCTLSSYLAIARITIPT